MKYLILPVVLLILFTAGACISESKKDVLAPGDYGIVLAAYNHGLDPYEIQEMMHSKSLQLVDIREGMMYQQGHLPDAISLPVGQFNNDGILKSLNRDGGQIVIYGDDEAQAIGPWSILMAKGFNDVFTSKAGYKVLASDSLTADFRNDYEKYDYVSFYESAIDQFKAKQEAEKPKPVIHYREPVQPKKKVNLTPKKKKPTVQEEGC